MWSTTFYRRNNCAHMKTRGLMRWENNVSLIGFIRRLSLSPLVPFGYDDVDSILHHLLLLLSPLGNEPLSSVNWFLPYAQLQIKHTHDCRWKWFFPELFFLSRCVRLHTIHHTGPHPGLCKGIHVGREEIQNMWLLFLFSCLLTSNPPNPLFVMLWTHYPCLNSCTIDLKLSLSADTQKRLGHDPRRGWHNFSGAITDLMWSGSLWGPVHEPSVQTAFYSPVTEETPQWSKTLVQTSNNLTEHFIQTEMKITSDTSSLFKTILFTSAFK